MFTSGGFEHHGQSTARKSDKVIPGGSGCMSQLKVNYWICRVPTRPGKPGKPGKMRVHLENLEISWNFEKFNKYHGKMT